MMYTASIYLLKNRTPGIRISVMSRHTLDDGKTQDPLITFDSYDYWYKDLAPNAKDVGAYLRGELLFEAYMERYVSFLNIQPRRMEVINLAYFALSHDITLLCKEEKADFCHRKTLAEECQRYEKSLIVKHI